MSFLDDTHSISAKLQRGKLEPTKIVGVALLVVAFLVVIVSSLLSSCTQDEIVYAISDEATQQDRSHSEDENQVNGDGSQFRADDTSAIDTQTWAVYVTGAVKTPGYYEVPANSRVNDAISLAGGFAKDADVASINLARALTDGEQIEVLTKKQVKELTSGNSSQGGVSRSETTSSRSSSQANSSSKTTTSGTSGFVNINTATAQELTSLPGIGEATAAKIIADRDKNGPFANKEDIKRVSGIGDKKYEALADLICV